MLKNIDTNDLSKINGGVLPGENGTCVPSPFPRPRPQPQPNPIDGILGGGRPGTGIGTLGGLPTTR